MAGIDHTIICFRNGKLLKEERKFIGEDSISNIPFDYTRDGIIKGYNMDKIIYDVEWNKFKFIVKWREKKAAKYQDGKSYSYYEHDGKEIYLYQSPDYNVTFYVDGKDAYAMLGGYGHYRNPYTHFYHRGYGEEFERKMAKECYQWLCDDVLKDIIDQKYGYFSYEGTEKLKKIRDLLHYKGYWDMTDEEHEWDNNHPMIDYWEEDNGN